MLKNKTVRRAFLCKLFFIFALFLTFGASVLFAVVTASCPQGDGQTHYGYYQGACWAYYCSGSTINKLGSVNSSYCGEEDRSSCSSVGSKHTIYTASGCSHTTCEKTCCSNKKWSECNKERPDPSDCASDKCWNGSSCVSKPTGKQYNGKCYYTCSNWVCNKDDGWSCSGKKYEKVQKGTWTYWGESTYYNSKPTSTCQPSAVSYMVPSSYSPSDELAATVCKIQAAALKGGDNTWSGSCDIVGNCFNGPSHMPNSYKCQILTLKCTEDDTCS